MFSLLAVGSLVGIVLLSGSENSNGSKSTKQEQPKEYTKEVVRANLPAWDYDNWDCEQITYELQDFWIKSEFESLMRRGVPFDEAIELLIKEGKIKRR